MLDVVSGDVLVVGSSEYDIVAAAQWTGALGDTAGFRYMATVLASTKRAPAVDVNGKRGVAVTKIASLYVTPFDILDASELSSAPLWIPMHTYRTYAADATGYIEMTLYDSQR